MWAKKLQDAIDGQENRQRATKNVARDFRLEGEMSAGNSF
jgi:hypothetical protein